MDDKYEDMSYDELIELQKKGDRQAEGELLLREMTEEEPPPRIPRGVSMDNLTNEQMDEFLEGKRGYTQGRDYPKGEAEKAMKEEEEFQVEEDVSAIRRKDDDLALQQFSKLKDAELYADMAEQLYGAGFTADVVAGILGMGVAAGASAGKETVEGVFATAEKMVKDPTLPREFLPYDRERIMKNLQDYRAHYMKQPEYVDVPGSFVRKSADVPTATRKAKAAENILVRMGDEGVGAKVDRFVPVDDQWRSLPQPVEEVISYPNYAPTKPVFLQQAERSSRKTPIEGYEGMSSYLKRNVPKSTFGESKMGTRPSRKPTEVKGELEIPGSPARYEGVLGMAVPGYDAYKGMEDAQRGKRTVREQQQALYESASPKVQEMIEDKLMGPEKPKREYSTDYRYK
jgi:hypothetical protein